MSKQIPLSQGKFATVDDSDHKWLSQWKWYAQKHSDTIYYAQRIDKNKVLTMHREIARPPDGVNVDHIDGNSLDNRRCNLRLCSHSENMRNRKLNSDSKTGIKGVSLEKRTNSFIATIQVDGKTIYLGRFDDPFDASEAYDQAAIQYHGAFASINGFKVNAATIEETADCLTNGEMLK